MPEPPERMRPRSCISGRCYSLIATTEPVTERPDTTKAPLSEAFAVRSGAATRAGRGSLLESPPVSDYGCPMHLELLWALPVPGVKRCQDSVKRS